MVLSVKKISSGYSNNEILNDLSCDIESGMIKGILGPNGSGKSTFLKTIIRLIPHNKGVISLDGKCTKVFSYKSFARKVAYVPQRIPEAAGFSVREFVEMGRYPYQGMTSADEDKAVVDEAMEMSMCNQLADKLCTNLSGGEMQRVVIAKALAQEPDYLLLDEPTANLDIVSVSHIGSMLKKVAQDRGIGVLLVSHDINFLSAISDKMMLLREGKVFDRGKPQNIISENNLQKLFITNKNFTLNDDFSYPQVIINY